MPPRPKKKALHPCSACWCLQNDFEHRELKTEDISPCIRGTIGGCCVGCCKLGYNVKFSEPGLHNLMVSLHKSNADPNAEYDFSKYHELKIGGNKQKGNADTHTLVVHGYLSSTNAQVVAQLEIFLWTILGAGGLPVGERSDLLGKSYLILGYFSLLFTDDNVVVEEQVGPGCPNSGLSSYRLFMALILSRLDEVFSNFLARCEFEKQAGDASKISISIAALRVAITDVLQVLESRRLALTFGGLELASLLEKRLGSISTELRLFQSSICWEEGDWSQHLHLPLYGFQQSMHIKCTVHSLKPHYYAPEQGFEPLQSSNLGGYASNNTSTTISEQNAPRSFAMQTEPTNYSQNFGAITYDDIFDRAAGTTCPLPNLYISKSFGISLETAYPPQDVANQNFIEHELQNVSNEDAFSHLPQLPHQSQFYPTSNNWIPCNEQFNYTWSQ